MSGDPVQHTCVPSSWGHTPSYPCPACHPYGWPATTYTFTSAGSVQRISDEDVERIARRVAELLKESE